jgi:hypothetical protein
MARRRFWIGSTGPFAYDDETAVPDKTGAVSSNQAGIVCTGQLRVGLEPSETEHVLRYGDAGLSPGVVLVTSLNVSLDQGIAYFEGTGGDQIRCSTATITLPGSIYIPAGQNLYIGGVPVSTSVGDVVGPASATDNAVARFDSTTGKLLQNCATRIDDGGTIVVPTGQNITRGAYMGCFIPGLDANGRILTGVAIGNGEIGSTATTITSAGSIGVPAGQSVTVGGVALTSNTGDVTGPASSVDNYVPRFHSTTGKVLQESLLGIDDSGTLVLGSSAKITRGAYMGCLIPGLDANGRILTGVAIGNGEIGSTATTITSAGSIAVPAGQTITIGGVAVGSGDVTGPASSVDNYVPRFHSTTGKILQESLLGVDDGGNLVLASTATISRGAYMGCYIPLLGSNNKIVASAACANGELAATGAAITSAGTINLPTGQAYQVNSTQVVGAQQATISTWTAYTSLTCPSGSDTIDRTTFNNNIQSLNVAQASLQTAVNALISRLQTHGLIA